jgi:hypothetical protein
MLRHPAIEEILTARPPWPKCKSMPGSARASSVPVQT